MCVLTSLLPMVAPVYAVGRAVGKKEYSVHIGVGFAVARSIMQGNAKASIHGTGDVCKLPRFSFCAARAPYLISRQAQGTGCHNN